MKNNTLIILFCGILASCSNISSKYVGTSDMQMLSVPAQSVTVYYSKKEVPFTYHEMGRVFLKAQTHYAECDPGAQILKIREEAAKFGAHAVIVENTPKRVSSFSSSNSFSSSSSLLRSISSLDQSSADENIANAHGYSDEVFQYSGIAIRKTEG